MIEGSTQGTSSALRYGMVGGGQGAFIGDVHRKAIALDGKAWLAAGCFSRSYENTPRPGARSGVAPDRLYRTFEEMAAAEVEAAGRDRLRGHRDAQRRPLPGRQGLPLPRHPGGLRQAAATSRSGRPRSWPRWPAEGPALRRHLHLHRLSGGEAGAGDDRPRRHRRHPLRQRRVPAGVAGDPAREGQARSRRPGAPTRRRSGKSNCVGDIGSHIENMVSLRDRPGDHPALRAARRLRRGPRRSTTTRRSWSSTRAGPRGSTGPRQIAVGYDNGLRLRVFGAKGSHPVDPGEPELPARLPYSGSRPVLSRGRDALSTRTRRATPASRRATRRATSKPSPTSTRPSPPPWPRRRPAAR